MRFFRRPPSVPRRTIPPPAGGAARSANDRMTVSETADPRLRAPIGPSLSDTLAALQDTLLDSDDVIVRRIKVGPKEDLEAAVIFAAGLVSRDELDAGLLKPVLMELRQTDLVQQPARRWGDLLRDAGITTPGVREIQTLADVAEEVLDGHAALLLDRREDGLSVNVHGWAKRAVTEAVSERIVRGPHEGFTETLEDNTALIRRRVKDPQLKIRRTPVGRRSRMRVAVVYLANLANPELLAEVRSRLDSIDVDRIVDSGGLEHFLVDNWASPFPQVEATERPDRTALALFEGRVAIMADGSPYALIVPTTFNALMISPEDYYHAWPLASAIRLVRFIAVIAALVLPSLWIGLVSFHQEMLPTALLISIGTARERTPFPSVVEAILMETALEVLREAGLRLPAPLGPTLGVVGGIVIGEAAIRANLVGPGLVIVVALTAIASFTIPNYELATAWRFLRFPLMLWTAVLGLFGMTTGIIAIAIHLTTLKSFGTYYLAPYAPQRPQEMKDSLIRWPLMALRRRAKSYGPLDAQRLSDQREEVVGPRGDE